MATYTHHIEDTRVYPVNLVENGLKHARENDMHVYRTAFDGSLVLIDDDYDLLYAIEKGISEIANRSDFLNYVIKRDSVVYKTFRFRVTDVSWEPNLKRCSVTNLDLIDSYTDIFENWDTEVNIINANAVDLYLPVRSELIIRFFVYDPNDFDNYTFDDSGTWIEVSVENYGTVRLWVVNRLSRSVRNVTLYVVAAEVMKYRPNSVPAISTDNTDGQGWVTTSYNDDGSKTMCRSWNYTDRDLYFDDTNESVSLDNKYYISETRLDSDDHVLVGEITSLGGTDYYCYVRTELYPAVYNRFSFRKTAHLVTDVMNYILSQSNLASYNFEFDLWENDVNKITGESGDDPTNKLIFIAESDVHKPFADEQDSEVITTLAEMLDDLTKTYNAYWLIDDTTIKIRHKLRLEDVDIYNLTVSPYAKYIRRLNNYTYEDYELVHEEIIESIRNSANDDFAAVKIEYQNVPLVDKSEKNVKEIQVKYTSDINHIQNQEYEYDSNGRVFLMCEADGDDYEILKTTNPISGNVEYNDLMSLLTLFYNYQRVKRPYNEGTVKSVTYNFDYVQRVKKQQTLTILDRDNELDPNKLYQSFAGIGEIDSMLEKFYGTWEIDLLLNEGSVSVWADTGDTAVVDGGGSLIPTK
jgi:hypothetical protein